MSSFLLLGAGTDASAGGGGGLDSATTAWVNQVVTNGGTVSAGRQTTVDTLIKGLKSDGVWTKLDRLWVFAAENSQSALTDMVGLTLAVANGAPTFTTDRGYTGVDSSTTVYINSGFNPTTATTPNYVQNSAHISAWSNTNFNSSGLGGVIMGARNTSSGENTGIAPEYSGSALLRINDATAQAGMTVTDSLGHYISNRSAAGATQGYKNGSSIGSSTQASGSISTANIAILGSIIEDNVTHDFGGAYQVTMASIGGSLGATDASNFYSRLRTYMTAVGVP